MSSYLYMQPILNLELSDTVHGELLVDDVLIISSARLTRVRNRVGFPKRISESGNWIREAVDKYHCFGIVTVASSSESALKKAETKIRDACFALRSANWPFQKRSTSNLLRVFGPADVAYGVRSTQLVVNTDTGVLKGSRSMWRRSLLTLRLDTDWHRFQKAHGILKKMNAFFQEGTQIEPEWRNAVRRAAILFGRSLQDADRAFAFLLDMIALDTLLLAKRDRAIEMFPRLDAVLGWSNLGRKKPWFENSDLRRLSLLRNSLVHNGDANGLQAGDLLLADALLGNVLSCVLRMGRKWGSRDSMIEFGNRVSCRVSLGQRPYASEGKLPFKVLLPKHSPAELADL